MYELKKGGLQYVVEEINAAGNVWTIAMNMTQKQRNNRVLFLQKYEIFIDFVINKVSETVRDSVRSEEQFHRIMSQVQKLAIITSPFFRDEDITRQMDEVFTFYESGKFMVTRETEAKLLSLKQLLVSEWDQLDLLTGGARVRPDDFTESVVAISDDIDVSDTFYTSYIFGFLYLGNNRQSLTVDSFTFQSVGHYGLFKSYTEFYSVEPAFAVMSLTKPYMESKKHNLSKCAQIIRNGLAVCSMEVVNSIADTIDFTKINDKSVFICQNQFLGSSDVRRVNSGSNFIGNYLQLLSYLIQLPMLKNYNVRTWAMTARDTSKFPSIKIRIPALQGISPAVARYLVLSFASGAVNVSMFVMDEPDRNDPFFENVRI
jgi:hypothetical protein